MTILQMKKGYRLGRKSPIKNSYMLSQKYILYAYSKIEINTSPF